MGKSKRILSFDATFHICHNYIIPKYKMKNKKLSAKMDDFGSDHKLLLQNSD